jgi:predicted nucleic acid-binding Zn ribbon protein
VAEFDYRCEVCSSTKTEKRPIGELERMPYCDSCVIPMRRVYNATPAIFKGSGWGGSK